MNDNILKEMYREYNIPCDRLVSDPDKLGKFTEDFNQRSRSRYAPARIGHRLLNLRRKGESKGGLVRLRRCYHGRQSQN